MKKSKFLERFGFKFIINLNPNSRRIHNLSQECNCGISAISKYKYCTRRKAIRLIKSGEYKPCSKCNKELKV